MSGSFLSENAYHLHFQLQLQFCVYVGQVGHSYKTLQDPLSLVYAWKNLSETQVEGLMASALRTRLLDRSLTNLWKEPWPVL